jgi:2-succinyl-5-enolpyruvyl-6-hydroxy-3-cyclohexene-1-carboxylate synthase
MIEPAPNLNYAWAASIIDELARNGVQDFALSPGSRSTPLTLAVAARDDLRQTVHFDERAAAFHALGMAKGTGAPSVFICTSGSAVVNAMPAVVEADRSHTPLIVLTADRPPELLDTGANQAIDQVNVFGNYVRWAHVFPCPDEAVPLESMLTALCQGVHRATSGNPGPVHLNCMFREPLAPTEKPYTLNARPTTIDRPHGLPFTEYAAGSSLESRAVDSVIQAIRDTDKGLLVAGQLSSKADSDAVVALAKLIGWPLLPDVTSGLRSTDAYEHTVHHYHHLLAQGENACGLDDAEVVLHLGGAVVSKAYLEFSTRTALKAYIRVDGHPERLDPAHGTTHRIQATPEAFAKALGDIDNSPCDEAWRARLTQSSAAVEACVANALDTEPQLSEAGSVRRITSQTPEGSVLFLGNSMPIRDADLFGATCGATGRVIANRGASGIDGNIATATGIARATGAPVTAILGDLAALHDLNSLALVKTSATPVILVIINNDGGGIFSFLPIHDHSKHFETHFGTPHGMNFRSHAEGFGLSYMQPETPHDLAAAYACTLDAHDSAIIEIQTDRIENLAHHRALTARIAEALAP